MYLINILRRFDVGYIGIAVTFMQSLSMFLTFKLKWPKILIDFFSVLSIFNLNIELVSPECFTSEDTSPFEFKFYVTLALPLIIAFVLVHGIGSLCSLPQVWKRSGIKLLNDSGDSDATKQSFVVLLIANMFLAMQILYFSLSRRALELFDCSYDASQSFFFEVEPMRQCLAQDWWFRLLPWSLLAIIFYVIGYPLLSAWLIFKRHEIFLKSAGLRKRWEVLVLEVTYSKKQEFKEKYEFWPVLTSLRQLALASIQLFFTGYAPLQVILMCLVFLGSIILQMDKLPYSTPSLNRLENVTLTSSMVVLMAGLLIHVSEFTDAQADAFSAIIILIVLGAAASVGYGLYVQSRVMYQDAQKQVKQEPKIAWTIRSEVYLDFGATA